jgi:hypothetical protein
VDILKKACPSSDHLPIDEFVLSSLLCAMDLSSEERRALEYGPKTYVTVL